MKKQAEKALSREALMDVADLMARIAVQSGWLEELTDEQDQETKDKADEEDGQ
ncbi:hypothetical protein ACFL6C_04055 [Myxococcota bacterium]